MPATKTQSSLAKALGARLGQSIASHKNDTTTLDTGGNLPDLEDGIAQLVELRVGYYERGDNKGKPYVMAMGTVKEPTEAVGKDGKTMIPVAGKQTKWGPEPLCDTKWPSGDIQSFDDHMANVLALLRTFGVNTGDLSDDGTDLEPTMAALVEAGPHFSFRVYSMPANPPQYPKAKYKEEWGRPVEYSAAVVDDVKKSFAKGAGVAATKGTSTKGAGKGPLSGQKDIPFGDNWDDLAVDAANADDAISSPAQDKLEEAAMKLGYSKQQVLDSESWTQVSEWVRSGKGPGKAGKAAPVDETPDYDSLAAAADGGDQASADKLDELRQAAGITDDVYAAVGWAELAALLNGGGDVSAGPKVTEIWLYKPMIFDPKKKVMVLSKTAVQHEVISVDEAAETVTLKSLETGKVVMDPKKKTPLSVQWSEIEADAS